MTYTEFIYLHPDFDVAILVELFNIIGITKILSLYQSIDNDHYIYVKELYYTVYNSSIGGEPSIIKNALKFTFKSLFFSTLILFVSVILSVKDEIDYDLILKYNLGELILMIQKMELQEEIVNKELMFTFITYLGINLQYDHEFLLILHHLLV